MVEDVSEVCGEGEREGAEEEEDVGESGGGGESLESEEPEGVKRRKGIVRRCGRERLRGVVGFEDEANEDILFGRMS